jgi:hypothetical protein
LVDPKVSALFGAFFPKPEIREKVLHGNRLQLLAERLGAPAYGECYIERPMRMLGGSGANDTVERGRLDVYLSLVGPVWVGSLVDCRPHDRRG